MEMALLVWLASVVSSLHNATGFLSFILGIAALASIAFFFVTRMSITSYDYDKVDGAKTLNDQTVRLLALTKIAVFVAPILFVLVGLLHIITPQSEKTIYLMAGAYATQQVATSEVGKDVVKIVELKVKDYLTDLEGEIAKKTEKK